MACSLLQDSIGTSIVTATLVEDIREQNLKEDSSTAINPVSEEEVAALVGALKAKLDAPPEWIQPSIVAIGGQNCIFRLACDVRGDVEGPLTPQQIYEGLMACANSSDEELQHLVNFEHSDPARIVVQKLALLWTVTSHLKLEEIHYQPCVGSCAGLLVSESYWP